MDSELKAARAAYKNAKAEGNHREEARWANVVGDILKNKGEYIESLKWLRIDYEVSHKYLPEKDLLPTCQSLGEIYLRLRYFSDALIYQKKHLELAMDSNDLVEQQRATTQLGRTYYELYMSSQHDHCSIRIARKYFKRAMELAVTLKENPPHNKSSFLKEYIDAHNNVGMLELEVDNLLEAKNILTRGLEICDEEEVSDFDDGRSRLHHNLGNVYMELRIWDQARKHIRNDIIICNKIEHLQGEAKGYINLGEVHYRTHKYEDARSSYQKALSLAKLLEDESGLVRQINDNIEILMEAEKVMGEIRKEEQNLKKLRRDVANAKGQPHERKSLLQINKCLEGLVEKSRMISAWEKYRDFAKERKQIASELCDIQRLGDSCLDVGESYQKLRRFNKAIKWYKKSRDMFKRIGNLEGQAMAKINIGNVLDSANNWRGALDAFQEGYSIAVEAGLCNVQLMALENMHYSNMVRFDDEDETRRLKLLIDELNKSTEKELEDYCSGYDTKAAENLSNSGSGNSCSPKSISRPKTHTTGVELTDDTPLNAIYRSIKGSSRKTTGQVENLTNSTKQVEQSPKSLTNPTSNRQTVAGRKRVRVILSDDDSDDEMECSSRKDHHCLFDDLSTDDAIKSKAGPSNNIQMVSEYGSKCANNVEESSSSFKCGSSYRATIPGRHSRSLSNDIVAEPDYPSGSKCGTDVSGKQNVDAHPMMKNSLNDQYITCWIGNDPIRIEESLCGAGDQLNIESIKAVIACSYYLQLPTEKRSEGLLPIVQHIKCGGIDIEYMESVGNIKEHLGNDTVDASIDGWVHKRLIKMYIDCCKELSEVPNMKVLKKLYNLEVSDDEIVVSECDLQDLSITPLIEALNSHQAFSMLDLSHNLLGNGTMEKLQKVFTGSGQSYCDLTLDLHCNRFGPTALSKICECPVLFARLEVLNISGNRLTDACGSLLATILKKCTALCRLNVENCSITSPTIQKISDALDSKSVLTHLCIGHNSPVSGNAIVNLLTKLSTLNRFSELNLHGLKLRKPAIDALCKLAETLTLSGLMLGGTGIGTEGAVQLTKSLLKGTEELAQLDLSYCGLTSNFALNINVNLFCSILELNLEGNPIMREGSNTLFSLLMNPQCCLKVLYLRKCQLGLAGVLHIIEALAENSCMEELNLAGNSLPNELAALQCDSTIQPCSQTQEPKVDPMKVDDNQEVLHTDYHQLEVADSEDFPVRVEAAASGIDDSCATSWQRNSLSPECQFTQKFAVAIGKAKNLQLLDLSDNDFSAQAAETFYGSWKTLRQHSSQKHITGRIIHLSTKENKCCRVKPCCKKV